MDIIVGSKSQSKIAAVEAAVENLGHFSSATVDSFKACSGVPDQPVGIHEITRGAQTRAEDTMLALKPDIAVGMEGGIIEVAGRWVDVGVVYALGYRGLVGVGISQGLALPDTVVKRMEKDHVDLSEAMQLVYGINTVESRDCSSFLSNGRLPSVEYYRQAVANALEDYQRQIPGYPYES